MKKLILTTLAAGLFTPAALINAQEPPKMPAPAKEHQWLNQFVGQWESEVEITMAPGQPPLKTKGAENCRSIGGFWLISEGKSEMGGALFEHLMTLGFDPAKQKYTGTWVDSMSSYQWKYEGTVDATGKVLTLDTEGPCPMKPGQLVKFKEVTEFKSPDHRTFTSSMQNDDGTWFTLVKGESRRKK